jgi:hypothetical protein
MRRMISRLKLQNGTALVMSVGILAMLTISGTTMVAYTTSNSRLASYSKHNELAFSLAEAGLNNAMAVLANPDNNALEDDVLPSSEATASSAPYEGGTARWYGTLDRGNMEWTITAIGLERNPTGAEQVRRSLVAKVPLQLANTQDNNSPAWNYIYARATGNTCDVTLSNNLSGQSRFYVAGNLCLNNNVDITSESLIVRGNLDLANNADVGTTSTRIEAHVGGNCRYGGGSWTTPNCDGDQDSRHIYSKLMPGGTVGVNSGDDVPLVLEPEADFVTWYQDAAPGPAQSCTSSSGTPPTFDGNYPARDNSVATFDLTPASSYSCRVGPGANTTLAAAMNATQTTLSVASASGFPTSTFRIRIDDEYLTVTDGFGTTTWTVTRGANGSTATSHVSSQTVNWDDSRAAGTIIWNATTKTLTLKGTMFIDGSASITNGGVNKYDGQATLYLSGVFYINNSSKLCGGVSGTECAFSAWNPNNELLTIVTNGSGGSAGVDNGILVDNNGQFQGGLFATYDVAFSNNSRSDGPIVGRTVKFSNNVQNDQFPTISTVPSGMPGAPVVRATPKPPEMFAG